MDKGVCYKKLCNAVFTVSGRAHSACSVCGSINNSRMALDRHTQQRPPTPDPIMQAVDVKAAFDAVEVPSQLTVEGRKVGKVRMDLLFKDMPRAIESLARVMTWAIHEKGYKESDWLRLPDAEQAFHGGLHRHDNKEMRGQEFDDESGLEHAIHTAWNAMARVEMILRRKEQDNANAKG